RLSGLLDRRDALERIAQHVGGRLEALVVEHVGHPLQVRLGARELALLDAAVDDVAELADVRRVHRLLERLGHLLPGRRADPRARDGAVVVLDRAAHLTLSLELDEAELAQRAHVVARVLEGERQLAGELLRRRGPVLEDPEDPHADGVRERLDQPGVVDVLYSPRHSSSPRSRLRSLCNRILTVPSGVPSRSAIWAVVRSWP